MMDLCYVRVVLKIWEIYGPEIRAKITDKITKIRHFKAKNRFLVIFRPFMCGMTSNLVWKAYEVCIYVCWKGFGWKCVVRHFHGF